jgi:hypothetical protein
MTGKGRMLAAVLSALVMSTLPLFYFSVDAQEKIEAVPLDGIPHRIYWGYMNDTDLLQGGKVLKLILGEEASLVFIWGTRENRGPVTVISKGVDILGHIDHGSKKVPIRSESVALYTLQTLVEFEDADHDGIYSQKPSLTADTPKDRTIKSASLDLAWTFQQRTPVNTKEGMEWTFSLEARNITYARIAKDTSSLTASSVNARIFLEMVRFIFHVRVTPTGEVRLLTDYRTTSLSSADPAQEDMDRRYEMEGLNCSVKMDHIIKGWDYAEDNRRPMLMLKFHLGIGRTFDASLVRDLYDKNKVRYYGDAAIWYASNGREGDIWTESEKDLRGLVSNTTDGGVISLKNERRPLAGFLWTGRSITGSMDTRNTAVPTVVLADPTLLGPFHGIWGSRLISSRLGLGVSFSGAFYYQGGADIYHDPEVRTVGWRIKPKADDGEGASILPGWLEERPGISAVLVISVIAVLVAVSIIAALTRRRFDMEDEELRREEEEEIFEVKTRKRDWDKLRPK